MTSKVIFVYLFVSCSAFAAPQVFFGDEEEEEQKNVIPADVVENEEQVFARQGTLDGNLSCGKYPVDQEIPSNRIVGGVPSAEKEVPWMASIQRDGVHICGGSLIRNQYILTAAHCVKGVLPKDITVVLGDWNWTAVNLHRKELSVDKIFVHELYNASSARGLAVNDVALIKTKDTVVFYDRISPICLQNRFGISEKTATVSGWGKLLFDQSNKSDVLMKVDLPLYDKDKCDEIFTRKYSFKTKMTHICAGNIRGRQNTCQGDSGGPLFISHSSGDRTPKWTLIGVFSDNSGCAGDGTLGLYTRVSEFISWIEEKIGEYFESIEDDGPDTFPITDEINIPGATKQIETDVGTFALPDQIIAPVQTTTKSSITSTVAAPGQNEDRPPVPKIVKTETTKVEVTDETTSKSIPKSPHAPNGPSNGYCVCIPAQNCANPGPASPGNGIGSPKDPQSECGSDGQGCFDTRIVSNVGPGVPGGVQPGCGPDGQGCIDTRIVSNLPSNVCQQPGTVYCCFQQPFLPPLPPPHPESFKRCGAPKPQPIPGFITDPTQAVFGEFPWMVVILDANNRYIGGGALVNEKHIITAAHKVAKYAFGLGIKVRLGEWNAKDNSEPLKYVEIQIQEIKLHPLFHPLNLKNNIAVLRLSEAVNFAAAPHVSPVCLPNIIAERYVGRRCLVTGWGKDAFGSGGQFQYILRKLDVPLLHSNDCEARLRRTLLGPVFELDRKSFVCAGGEPGKDACQGDGGSPMVCEVEPNLFVVVGLVAWGVGCADPGIPGVYVNVGNYVDWIISVSK